MGQLNIWLSCTSDVPAILLHVNRQLNEIWNIDRRSKTTLLLYLTHTFYIFINFKNRGRHGRDRIVVNDLQLPLQSVRTTANVVSLNPVHDEMYSIQHDVIKFVSDFWQIGGFLWFPQSIKLTATIFLKYCWKWCYIP
jgi:hypothetical protein